MVKKHIDLTGQKFGRLTAVRPIGSNPHRQMIWLCSCSCGGSTEAKASALKDGNTASCGCARKENFHRHTHMMTRTPEYRTWAAIHARCHNPNIKGFAHYGAKGIRVSDRWSCFENFFKDMGSRPSSRHSIDRIDNNLGYSKENCRWATKDQQSRNRSVNVMITAFGKTLCLHDWCTLTGMKFNTVRTRIRDQGWSPEKALSTPPLTTNKRKAPAVSSEGQ